MVTDFWNRRWSVLGEGKHLLGQKTQNLIAFATTCSLRILQEKVDFEGTARGHFYPIIQTKKGLQPCVGRSFLSGQFQISLSHLVFVETLVIHAFRHRAHQFL